MPVDEFDMASCDGRERSVHETASSKKLVWLPVCWNPVKASCGLLDDGLGIPLQAGETVLAGSFTRPLIAVLATSFTSILRPRP